MVQDEGTCKVKKKKKTREEHTGKIIKKKKKNSAMGANRLPREVA